MTILARFQATQLTLAAQVPAILLVDVSESRDISSRSESIERRHRPANGRRKFCPCRQMTLQPQECGSPVTKNTQARGRHSLFGLVPLTSFSEHRGKRDSPCSRPALPVTSNYYNEQATPRSRDPRKWHIYSSLSLRVHVLGPSMAKQNIGTE